MAKIPFIQKGVFTLNLLAALLLLATYPAPYISPETFWPAALIGLAYPFALALNLVFVLYWLLKKRFFYLALSLAFIFSGFPLLKNAIAFNVMPIATENSEQSVKIMTYNVKNFDLYNWFENEDARNNMVELIKKEQPDIICFQEFYTEDEGTFHNVKLLVNELDFSHHHFEKTLSKNNTNHFGVAVFSKHPITHNGKIEFENAHNNVASYVDIELQAPKDITEQKDLGEQAANEIPAASDETGEKIRLYNVHLQSIHLGRADLKYVKEISGGGQKKKEGEKKKTSADHIKSSASILKKLRRAFQKRGKQAEAVAESVKKSPFPVVICGDFNDTPSSYTYKTIVNGLKDAFLEAGIGIGTTYAGPLPSLRIDYILVDSSIKVNSFDIINEEYSDHYPVSCVIEMP